jgi:Tol biopolymer transport system component
MRRSRLSLLAAPALALAACHDGTGTTAPAAPPANLALAGGGGSDGPNVPQDPCSVAACLGGGGRIAFVQYEFPVTHIYTVSANGYDLVRVDKDASVKRHVTWSPGYTKLAYATDRLGGGYEIYTMNADGTGRTNVRSIATGSVTGLTWSPDGTKIVFGATDVNSQGDIIMISASGNAVYHLTNDPALDWHPSFSSDGSRILFVSSRNSPTGQLDIWSMTTAGADLQRLTNTPEAEDAVHMSPNGTKLAYHTFVRTGVIPSTDQNKIVIANADGTGAQAVKSFTTGTAIEGLGWSRDGRYLVFALTWDGVNTTIGRWEVGTGLSPVALTLGNARRASPSWHY